MADSIDMAATQAKGGGTTTASTCKAYLIALSPSLMNREYVIGPLGITVGRDASCEVVVSGATVSRQHFRIDPDDRGRWILRDLNSTNGVFVNRRRVEGPLALDDGDLIGIGAAQAEYLRFQTESGRAKPWVMALPSSERWRIGRAPASDIALSFDSTVSSNHAVVMRRGDRLEIQDLRSLNGTYVNGRRIRREVLEPADTVTVGSTALRFQVEPAGGLRVVRRDCRDEIALECVDVTRQVGGVGSKGKRILDRVMLAIKPGEFVGLLGPSGAGKSTLLKALNGYNPPDRGCVLLNETPLYRSFAMFRNVIGYVPQDDIVHAELTVETSLDYVARLRLPPDVAPEQRRELIDSTIETLGLSHVRKNRIHELSGGQRKRVSIGCELITRPSVLFLDEPTSGMDPSTEERLMRHFQAMARRGTTVLITTHILYNLGLLDRVVILSRGRLVFFGTPGEALGFFSNDGKPLDRPTEIFDVLEGETSTGNGVPSGDRDAIAEHFQEKYLKSDLFKRHVAEQLSDVGKGMTRVAAPELAPAVQTPAPPSTAEQQQYAALLEKPVQTKGRMGSVSGLFSPRSWKTLTQRQFAVKLVSPKRALFYLAVPLVLALVTLSLPTNPLPDDAAAQATRQDISARIHNGPIDIGAPIKALLSPQGAEDPRPAEDVVYSLQHETVANLPTPLSVLLMFVMTAVFMGTLMACLDISSERAIYTRERMANGRIADYLASKLPFLLAATALQCALFLGLCWLKPGLRIFDFGGAYLALVMMAWTSCALGLFLSALDPTPGQFSVILAIVVVLPQLVFSGGLGPDFYGGMSPVMKAFASALPARWGLEMLMTAFYRQPDHTALAWTEGFIRDTVGFRFGPQVYLFNSLVLPAQALGWLVLSGLVLKRLDRVR
jgi:ABC-type multidrug transport system ATPase subunit/pSer/pThr/pTyr-binding forkhead associated (FHA) protein